MYKFFFQSKQNSPLVTSTQDYNSFTGSEATAQTGSLRSNEANDFRSTVTIPTQVINCQYNYML